MFGHCFVKAVALIHKWLNTVKKYMMCTEYLPVSVLGMEDTLVSHGNKEPASSKITF